MHDHRLRVPRPKAKACESCRRRKVRCEIDARMTRCRACERRMSPCSLAQAIPGPGLQPPSVWPPNTMDEPVLATPTHPAADNKHPTTATSSMPVGLPTPTLEETEANLPFGQGTPDLSTALAQCPLMQYFDTLCEQPTNETDPFSSLLCFALPRSLVGGSGSSPCSLFSEEGQQWLNQTVGEDVFNRDLLFSPSLFDLNPFGVDHLRPSVPLQRPFIPLPPKDTARCLLNKYFQSFNTFCPTFDENEFMLHFEEKYPIQLNDSSPEVWACLNAALALACPLDPNFYTQAWLYWKNAALSWSSFFTAVPSLVSAQALVAMAVYLVGTFHSNPSSAMLSMAVRMIRSLAATHEAVSDQFRLVHMIVRALDIDHALQVGTPPTEVSPDDYPEPFLNVAPGPEDSTAPFDCYEAFCALIRLKEDVYRLLYSVSARDDDSQHVISTVSDLDARLEQWKDSIPPEYRPDHPLATETVSRENAVLIVHLHLSYYNCLLTIHRRAIPCTDWARNLDPLLGANRAVCPSNPRALISTQLCASAARASLKLVKHIPLDNPLICGVMAHYVIFALKLFVILVVQDPWSSRAPTDLKLLSNMEGLLSSMSMTSGDQSILKLMEYCAQYRQMAEKAIEQALLLPKRRRHEQPGPEGGEGSKEVEPVLVR
ncbi:hypothetical protein BJX61DRAFT_151346 [Aspergillus egyptiacus]|nr:hypothetical protein BJX61DRAFT_151346 [Aspergillus egyptiacus]